MVAFDINTIDNRQAEETAQRASRSLRTLDTTQVCIPPSGPNGHYVGQVFWSIFDTQWRQSKAVWGPKVH